MGAGMKPNSIANVIFATALGVLGACALLHWALTCNVVS